MITPKKLNYEFDSLSPFISEETMEYHWEKHYKSYVNNTNKLIENTVFKEAPLNYIVQRSRGSLYNNAAQVWNHEFFFEQLKKDSFMSKELEDRFIREFGSVERFKEIFEKQALDIFGSGWCWLCEDDNKKLILLTTKNGDTPLGIIKPILVLDIWEHAYYIDYKNNRKEYIKKFWNIVNWKKIEERLLDL